MKKPVNVIILEDHPIVAQAIKDRLASYPVTVVGSLRNVEGLVSLPFEPAAVDLWIIDLELGSANSWTLIEQLSSLPSPPGIIVYTMHSSPWVKQRLSALDVRCMVNKSDAIEELDRAIIAYLNGEPYMGLSFRSDPQVEGLTKRENDVLGLLAKGLSTLDIAEALGVSESTVQTYRKSLMVKFGVHKIADLIAKSRGLV